MWNKCDLLRFLGGQFSVSWTLNIWLGVCLCVCFSSVLCCSCCSELMQCSHSAGRGRLRPTGRMMDDFFFLFSFHCSGSYQRGHVGYRAEHRKARVTVSVFITYLFGCEWREWTFNPENMKLDSKSEWKPECRTELHDVSFYFNILESICSSTALKYIQSISILWNFKLRCKYLLFTISAATRLL